MPTKIEWTDETWNPATGCTKVSSGCKNCYAKRMAERLQRMGSPNYSRGFEVAIHPHMLAQPRKWKTPRRVFVCSMADLFHEQIPIEFILKVLGTIESTPQHEYQILTKRPERLSEVIDWPSNVWVGTSVENNETRWRIDELRRSQAPNLFLSCEPLLGPLPELDLRGIGWVIVGGESGPDARRMRLSWATEVRDRCASRQVPFFFKQWGAFGSHGIRRAKRSNGRTLEGRTHDSTPHARGIDGQARSGEVRHG